VELFLPLEIPGHCIREYRDEDVAAMCRLGSHVDVWRQMGDAFPHPYTEADAHDWLDTVAHQDRLTCFAIAAPDGLCGGIGLTLQADTVYAHDAEVGYWVGKPYWNRGIATAAVRAFTAWSQASFQLDRLTARVFAGNEASMRVLEKCGYVREGTQRRMVRKQGRVLDLHLFGWLAQ